MGAGVQPRVATALDFEAEFVLLQIRLVEVGDFQLTARRGLDIFGQFHRMSVMEIEAGDGMARFWLTSLLVQRHKRNVSHQKVVERRRIELPTFALRTRRSPS